MLVARVAKMNRHTRMARRHMVSLERMRSNALEPSNTFIVPYI
jgi:hypothetical protein